MLLMQRELTQEKNMAKMNTFLDDMSGTGHVVLIAFIFMVLLLVR